MKKLTKKMISEAPKFMIAIDYLTSSPNYNRSWHKVALTAENMMDAMDETETYFKEDVYMIHILQKSGTEQVEYDLTCITYDAILATRYKGAFHRHDDRHGENENMRFGYNPLWSSNFDTATFYI